MGTYSSIFMVAATSRRRVTNNTHCLLNIRLYSLFCYLLDIVLRFHFYGYWTNDRFFSHVKLRPMSHTQTHYQQNCSVLLYFRSLFVACHHQTFVGKAVPLQAWSGPEGSRKLTFIRLMTYIYVVPHR